MEHASHHTDPPVALVPLLILVGPLLAYLAAVVRLRRRTAAWPTRRIVSFTVGIALLAAAFLPPVSVFAHNTLRGHIAQHLLLGMFAPLGLVFGAPGTLLLRSVPVSDARRLVAILGSRPLRLLTHPMTAAVLDIGGMYLLYLTSLYALTLSTPLLAGLVHLHFVVAGYLFTWAIVGPDPAPHRPGRWVRLTALFGAIAAHAILGKLMYGYGFPRETPYDLTELQAAAQWMYRGGDLAEVLLAGVFFARWIRQRRPGMTRPTTADLAGAAAR